MSIFLRLRTLGVVFVCLLTLTNSQCHFQETGPACSGFAIQYPGANPDDCTSFYELRDIATNELVSNRTGWGTFCVYMVSENYYVLSYHID